MKVIYAVKNSGLLEIPSLLPEPMKTFAPEWWKKMPIRMDIPFDDGYVPYKKSNFKSARQCPSFVEVFKEGYVIKAASDMWFFYDDESKRWRHELPTSGNFQMIETHANEQFVDYLPEQSDIKFVFKYTTPYLIFTDKGYSTRQIPMPYDFNKDWHVSYGVYKTDKLHEVNIHINFTSEDKEILIKQGTPLCVHIPYKRIEPKLKIVEFDGRKDLQNKWKKSLLLSSFGNFKGGYFKHL